MEMQVIDDVLGFGDALKIIKLFITDRVVAVRNVPELFLKGLSIF